MSSTTGCVVSNTVDPRTGVAVVEFSRPPHNFFDVELVGSVADTYAALDADARCRAIVLCSPGRHFCAGANFSGGRKSPEDTRALYEQAARLFSFSLPVVAAVQGRAVGGGLGIAMSADFRVASPSTRFVCNFARLGIHHGFGLSVTLPAVVGQQKALELLYTGEDMAGEAAFAVGLCDRILAEDDLQPVAVSMAERIAESAPLAVRAIRRTMWTARYKDLIREATRIEFSRQAPLFETADFREGVRATSERRVPQFRGS